MWREVRWGRGGVSLSSTSSSQEQAMQLLCVTLVLQVCIQITYVLHVRLLSRRIAHTLHTHCRPLLPTATHYANYTHALPAATIQRTASLPMKHDLTSRRKMPRDLIGMTAIISAAISCNFSTLSFSPAEANLNVAAAAPFLPAVAAVRRATLDCVIVA